MGVNFDIGVFPGGDEEQTPSPVVNNDNAVKYVIDVVRKHPVTQDIYREASVVEVVKPGGTVVNIGAGPTLPPNPYEGQVWILT